MFSLFRRSGFDKRSGTGRVLLAHRDVLVDRFGAQAEVPHYCPDLYPEQLKFSSKLVQVQAAILEDRCLHAMLVLEESSQRTPLLEVLAEYSGMDGWTTLQRDDPLIGEHFPAFNPSGSKNTFYASKESRALALVQVGTPFGPVVVWLQTAEYPARLTEYRRRNAGCA